MSYFDYIIGQEISAKNYPFYALIQAAMRQADTNNLYKLESVFPHIAEELRLRYNAPGGLLGSEQEQGSEDYDYFIGDVE